MRCVSTSSGDKVFITTPIFYVNAAPHIGHVHSAVLADALARWHRLKQQRVVFTTGTDEHGLKVQEAAEKTGTTDYQAFCDDVSSRFNHIFQRANVEYSRFIRTSEPEHHAAVAAFWKAIQETGNIYLGEHEAWYCKSDEAFLTETQVEDVTDPTTGEEYKISKESGHRVEKFKEENYKFRLSAFQDRLLQWLDANPDVIVPKSRHNEVRAAVSAGLRDVSVSRLREKIRWAIDVPEDPRHCVYVWLDALTNYITCAGYPTADKDAFNRVWPADYQIVGKDILKFHAIYWPAFLMAAGLPLPKKIVAHAHWTVDNVKMSKSLGNVVDPQQMLDHYGADFVRYFLLREGVLNDDGDFSTTMLEERVNSELADTLGNLVSRSTAKSFLKTGVLPCRPDEASLREDDRELVTRGQALAADVARLFETPDFSAGIKEIVFYLHEVNRYFTANEPWVLAKRLREDPEDHATQQRLDTVLYLTIDSLRMAAILLQPIVPGSSTKILDYLQVPSERRAFSHATLLSQETRVLGERVENTKSFVAFKKLLK
ncbi:hypothetical protein Poli38472_002785 [Pythium oligandrum]|uniref:methionine--tRNA ligase n=1 Tax=Pythium oligandrum TaxID=41045 RepID=A0A8K1CIT9_PYTOL|nr:hypothetical protein Poli38472_002785 [Pythium oligandrum]|eukprot:TMW63844.1 hypothetical protein Poli38472_002785 [Pythium oligandrum]